MHVIIEDKMVVTLGVDKDVFPMAIEAPDDIICGDIYVDGEFHRITPRPEPQPITPNPPPTEEYLIDLDYRLSLIELGL